jgi:hypothetical protein
MVGVLMGDQHGVEVADVVERGKDARIEKHPRAVGLGQQAGVAQMCQLHRSAPRRCSPAIWLDTLTLR